jgi:hypothetical protein
VISPGRPGRWLQLFSLGHAALGVVVYRRELLDIASGGFIDTVPYRSRRAAALWFIGAALPGWLVGHLADVAADAGDMEAVRLAGLTGLAGGIGGALLMPTSPLWLQAVVCARMVHESRL